MRPSIIKMLIFVNNFVFFVVFFFNILNFTSCGTHIVKINIYVSSIISVNMWSQCERSEKNKRHDVLNYIKDLNADIICLQDTHWVES